MKLATAILLLGAAPALAVELPPDLAQAVKEYDRAQVQNDIPTLSRLVADDYVLVNSNATVENKEQFLADLPCRDSRSILMWWSNRWKRCGETLQ